MTNPPIAFRPTRAKLVRLGMLVWAALVSAIAVANLINLSTLTQRSDASASSMKVSALETRLAELSQQIEAERTQPPSLSEARFESAQQALEQRLAMIERTLGERLTESDLTPLRERLDRIEARLANAPAKPTPARSRGSAAKPIPAALPFTIVGLELRGGEPFLSIIPTVPSSAAAIGVLHPGESEAGWRLEAIEGRTAVLRNGTQLRRVDVP